MVSGTFHSPHRGSFHFSLALLITIGRRVVLSLTGWSPRIHTSFLGTGVTWDSCRSPTPFAYETVTLYGRPFQSVRLDARLVTSWWIRGSTGKSHNPSAATATTLHDTGLGSSPFARHYSGSRVFFPFLEVLRCFSSLRSPPHGYGFTVGSWSTTSMAFPHLRNPWIKACLAAPQGLSQLCHVFHRLSTPKHSPCTLLRLVLFSLRSRLVHLLPDFQRPRGALKSGGLVAHRPIKDWWRRRGSNP